MFYYASICVKRVCSCVWLYTPIYTQPPYSHVCLYYTYTCTHNYLQKGDKVTYNRSLFRKETEWLGGVGSVTDNNF